MDGSTAIDRNLEVLTRILAALVAMAGFGETFLRAGSDAAGAKTLPRHLHRAVLRILRPAEAATRRLIIALAHGIVVKLPPSRPPRPKPKPVFLRNGVGTGIVMPRGQLVALPGTVTFFPGNGGVKSGPGAKKGDCPLRPLTLPLLDPLRDPFRRPPRRRPVQRAIPRISFFDGAGRTPIVLKQPPSPDDSVDAARLGHRLAGLGSALDDLPKQARRFARWRARRDRALSQDKIHRLRPLRPGCPPGGRLLRYDPTAKRGRNIREVDEVLAHAHALAWWALEHPDTS